MQKVFLLGFVGFRPLTLFRRTDRTMEAAHPEIVDFQKRRMPDDVVRYASAKTDGGLETCSGPSL
jgi:hypothetical protein